ncbi:MAG: hypothetical protein KA035_03845 [Candidatus Levybacteria bacterium]|nr:hypothetical protein [Candidatus Levybacteria bacterium]
MEPSSTPQASSTHTSTITRPNFPSIGTLFGDTWAMFKGSVLNLVIVNVLYIAVCILVFIGAATLLIPLGGLTVFQAIQNQTFKPEMLIPLFISGGVILIFLGIFFTILGFALTAAQIFIAGNYKEKHSLGLHIKKSFPKILPLFVVGLITGFITTGGFLLFVIPGIIFTIFFMFASYEVVLNNQGILSSIKRSVKLVSHNFGEVFVRVLLLIGLYIAYSVVKFFIDLPISLISQVDETLLVVPFVWAGISYFIEFFIWIYILCYSLTLYKQAAAGLESEKGSGKPLLWMFISSIIGWILGVLLIAVLGVFIWSMINSQAAKTGNTTIKTKEAQIQKPETKEALLKSDDLYKKITEAKTREEIIELNDERIEILEKAAETDSKNVILWQEIAAAYSYASSIPNASQNMIDAASKAIELDPTDYEGYSLLGLAYFYANDPQNSVLQYEKAIRINPNFGADHYNLARGYNALGIKDQALSHYNKAIELYSKDNASGANDAVILEIRKDITEL